MCVIEELERRLLLSAVATPNVVLFNSLMSAQPADSIAPHEITPAQLRTAYGIDQTYFGSIKGDGTGQTIAIVDAYNDPNIAADLAAFDALYNLPAASLTVIPQRGQSRLPSTGPSGNEWQLETSLDVEWAHVVAPGASIVLVEARSDGSSDLFAAVDAARRYAGVSVVSMSWGTDEYSGITSNYDTYLTTRSGHVGVTFVAASGDWGDYAPNAFYPAASTNVLSVGGTSLITDANGNYVSESGWSGSGGGVSQYISQPSYQAGVVPSGITTRALPDVAAIADPSTGVPVIDSFDFSSSPIQVGGTSLASPVWAGIIALANQGRVMAGELTLNSAGATQALPKIYSLPATDFHDITAGSNGVGQNAVAGYDLVTGRGSPIVNQLAVDLMDTTWPKPTIALPTAGLIAGQGWSVTLAATVADADNTVTGVNFYDGSTLLGPGVLAGGTWTYAWDTTTATVGTHTILAKATDSAGLSANTLLSTTVTIRISGDANGDGLVDGLDYGIWQTGYGAQPATFASGDFNGDGVVDGLDYAVWQDHYGMTSIATAASLPTAAATTMAGQPVVAPVAAADAPTPQAAAEDLGFLRLVAREPRSVNTDAGAAVITLDDAAAGAADLSVLAMARAIVGTQAATDSPATSTVAGPSSAAESFLAYVPAAGRPSVADHVRLGFSLGAEGLNLLALPPLDIVL